MLGWDPLFPTWVPAPKSSCSSLGPQTSPYLTTCTWARFSCDFLAKVNSTWDWIFLGVGAVGGTPGAQEHPHGPVVALTWPPPSDDAEQVWVWEYETEEGAHDLYMDTGEEIRFRVVDESFVDTSPTGPSSAEAASTSEELPKKEAPYTLVVRCPDVLLKPQRPCGVGATSLRGDLGPAPRTPSQQSGCRSLCGLGQSLLPGEPWFL